MVERAEVSSVLRRDHPCRIRFGRFVTGIRQRPRSRVLEDGVPQMLDVVRPETLPATYTLLVDSSQSMTPADGLRPRRGGDARGIPAPAGPHHRGAVLENARAR